MKIKRTLCEINLSTSSHCAIVQLLEGDNHRQPNKKMTATLPTPTEFHASPDSEVVASTDGISAHFSKLHDRLTIVDDDSGFTITNLRLNGMDALTIATKYIG
jgi:hypothetical protein